MLVIHWTIDSGLSNRNHWLLLMAFVASLILVQLSQFNQRLVLLDLFINLSNYHR